MRYLCVVCRDVRGKIRLELFVCWLDLFDYDDEIEYLLFFELDSINMKDFYSSFLHAYRLIY